MIPKFNKHGNLPSGVHIATLEELIKNFGYNSKRLWLIDGLNLLIENLEKAGCTSIYIDGSFVTKKETPGDYDLCWSVFGVDPHKVDPILLKFTPDEKSKAEIKYRGDIFPAELPEGGSGKLFLDFFQTDKNTGNEKGIIQIKIGSKV